MGNISAEFYERKLSDAKNHFERALDCKHTEFDDLYPLYDRASAIFLVQTLCSMVRAVNDREAVRRAGDGMEAAIYARSKASTLASRVMSSRVLDEWYETNDSKEHVS